MITKVQKWGNSQGLRFSRQVLLKASIRIGEEVDVSVKHGVIIVKPATKCRGKYKLEDLVSSLPADYHLKEVDWGNPSGKEVW